ncbi:hypothetical protein LRS06_22255 [Hymenobacter sp. J193]|uniref:hypothetical protein n=1 Tax=Hymenobacter sp. J193 TaxID=2898429 RepID=UPI0021510DE6|nr:hypothetical protein [Hymenobacter sp. J193]MCR5890297.1 hypothetical protein [Hymenobacter sp. J193]MCR5890454.1 hypothetical protein [Hymenobacter sp. J193]
MIVILNLREVAYAMPLLKWYSTDYRLVAARYALGWLLCVSGSSLSACTDLFTRETPIYGPYYVARDPSASGYSLFYRGPNGVDFDRFQDVSRVGYQAGYVFIQSGRQYYWFAVRNDRSTDAGDPAIGALISKPLTSAQFQRLTDSLGTGPIAFQFQE